MTIKTTETSQESTKAPVRKSSTRTKKGTIRKKPGPKAKPGPKGLDREKILKQLKKFLQLGLTIERSCNAYNAAEYDKSVIEKRKAVFIAPRTVQQWAKDDEEFRGKIEFYQDTPNVLARQTWREKIEKGDYQAAKDWLERKEKNEFSLKTEVDHTSKGKHLFDRIKVTIEE